MSVIVASIGGIDLRLHTNNPAARTLLRRRMRGFAIEKPHRTPIDIHFDVEGPNPIFVSETELCLQRSTTGDLFFETPGGRGEVSYDNVEARLCGRFVTQSMDAIIRLVLSRALLSSGALLIHASAVTHDERGFAFSGPSGAGKSTIADTLPLPVLSDEAVVIGRDVSGLYLRGTPYWKGSSRTASLSALFFIERGAFAVEPVSGAKAAARLFAAVGPLPESEYGAALDRAAELTADIPMIARVALDQRPDIIQGLLPILALDGSR